MFSKTILNEKNIYVRMRGGLGNQMFQFAYAYVLQKDYSPSTIVLDIREYNKYRIRNFELQDLKLSSNVKIYDKGHLAYDFFIPLYKIKEKLKFLITGHISRKYSKLLLSLGMIFCGGYCDMLKREISKNEIFMYGYFQSAGNLIPYRQELCELFTVADDSDFRLKNIRSRIKHNAVAVSIRIGNDVSQAGWSIVGRAYYESALRYIQAKKTIKQLVVFSDDINRVKKEGWFADNNLEIIFMEDFTPCQQIYLMRQCNDFIITNSTFSWWGAFLGSSGKESLVVAPKYWQGDLEFSRTPLVYDEMYILNEY